MTAADTRKPLSIEDLHALRAAIRPYIVDERDDMPSAPHEEQLLDDVMAAALPVLRDEIERAYRAGYDAGHADGCGQGRDDEAAGVNPSDR